MSRNVIISARWVGLALAGLLSARAQAVVVYVVDDISIGLHASAQITSPVEAMVSSGTALDVIEREGPLMRVRAPGGAEGWIDAAYVTSQLPMAARFKSLEATNEALQVELATVRSEVERLKSDLLDSEDNRKKRITAITRALEAQLDAKNAELEALRGEISAEREAAATSEAEVELGALRTEMERLRALNTTLANASKAQANAPIPSAAQRDLQALAEENHSLKQDLGALRAELRALRAAIAEQAAAAPAARSSPVAERRWNPYDVALAAFSALALLGIGALGHDYTVRLRHGGFRL